MIKLLLLASSLLVTFQAPFFTTGMSEDIVIQYDWRYKRVDGDNIRKGRWITVCNDGSAGSKCNQFVPSFEVIEMSVVVSLVNAKTASALIQLDSISFTPKGEYILK